MKHKLYPLLSCGALALCTLLAGCSSTPLETPVADEETMKADPMVVTTLGYAEVEDNNLLLAIDMEVHNGSFADDFDAEDMTFGGALAGAQSVKVEDMNEERTSAVLWLGIDKGDLNAEDLNLSCSVTFAKDSLADADGTLQEEKTSFDFTLVSADADKAAEEDTSEYILMPDTNTVVMRFHGSGTSYENVRNAFLSAVDTFESHRSWGSVEYMVIDLTDCTSLPDRVASFITDMMARQSTRTYFVNMDFDSTGYSFGDEWVDLGLAVSGDNSLINYSSPSIYQDIDEMAFATQKLTLVQLSH
jgi:hypothetical protein